MRLIERFIAFQRAEEAERIVATITRSWAAPDLVDQALRAATSVTQNLSEGTTRPPGSADRLRFYRYAWGSAAELEAILDSASRRDLGPPDLLTRARALTSEVARILTVIVSKP